MKRLSFVIAAILLAWSAIAQDEVLVKGQDESEFRRPIRTDAKGRAQGSQGQKLLDPCDATTGWTVLGSDTEGLSTDLDHVEGTNSLEFDKVDSVADTVFAGIQKTLASVDVAQYMENNGFVLVSMNLSSLADVDYCFVRLGTDGSNYNEWRVDSEALSTGWVQVRYLFFAPSTAGNLGNGLSDASAVTYVALGCAFSAESSTLADIRVDNIAVNAGAQVMADFQSQAGAGGAGGLSVKVQDGDGTTLQDVQGDFADDLPYTLNGAMVGAVAYGDDGAKLDKVTLGATGGVQVEVVNHPAAFDESAGNVDVDIDNRTAVHGVPETSGQIVGTPVVVCAARDTSTDYKGCFYLKNQGGGGGGPFTAATWSTSSDNVDWTDPVDIGAPCNALTAGKSCIFCWNDSLRWMRLSVTAAAVANDTTAKCTYEGQK